MIVALVISTDPSKDSKTQGLSNNVNKGPKLKAAHAFVKE